MNNRRSTLVVLLLRNPHFLEGRQTGEDRPSNPGAVLAFRRGDDFHSGSVRREGDELFAHAVGDPGIHGRPTGEDDVAVPKEKGVRNQHVGGGSNDSQVAPDIDVAGDDLKKVLNRGVYE